MVPHIKLKVIILMEAIRIHSQFRTNMDLHLFNNLKYYNSPWISLVHNNTSNISNREQDFRKLQKEGQWLGEDSQEVH